MSMRRTAQGGRGTAGRYGSAKVRPRGIWMTDNCEKLFQCTGHTVIHAATEQRQDHGELGAWFDRNNDRVQDLRNPYIDHNPGKAGDG